MALVVKSFTVSKLLETHYGGGKNSEFLSMKFESDISLTPEQAIVQQLEAHEIVERSLAMNALASGMLTKEAAKNWIEQMAARHDGILTTLRKKYGDPSVDTFLGPDLSPEDP